MATPNITPQATGEGSIGTLAKPWGSGYFNALFRTGSEVYAREDNATEAQVRAGISDAHVITPAALAPVLADLQPPINNVTTIADNSGMQFDGDVTLDNLGLSDTSAVTFDTVTASDLIAPVHTAGTLTLEETALAAPEGFSFTVGGVSMALGPVVPGWVTTSMSAVSAARSADLDTISNASQIDTDMVRTLSKVLSTIIVDLKAQGLFS
jgi:hypothetical protein